MCRFQLYEILSNAEICTFDVKIRRNQNASLDDEDKERLDDIKKLIGIFEKVNPISEFDKIVFKQTVKQITVTEYEPTDEIQRMTNEINRLLDSEVSDRENIEALIIKCAQLKYSAICEVKQ